MNLNGIILVFIVTLIYGITAILHKVNLKKCNITTLFVIYGVVYTVIVFLIAALNIKTIRADIKNLKRADVFMMSMTGLAGLIIANYLYLYLLQNHQSFAITAFVSTAPLFTMLFAYLYLEERVTPIALIGVCMIVVGVVLLAYGK